MTNIDEIDRRILHALENDGRQSNVKLAQQVGLSASACLRRVQQLERSGIVSGYRAIIHPKARGVTMQAYVMVGLSKHTKDEQMIFEQAMQKAAEVRECHNITGAYEYLLRVETADLVAYKHFHTEVLGALPLVSTITTYIVMESPKDLRA